MTITDQSVTGAQVVLGCTDIGPTNGGLDMSTLPVHPTRSVYLAVLKKTDPSPLAPESDEEKVAEEKKDGESGGAGDGEKKADAAKPADKSADKKEPLKVVIDVENIGQRIIALPIPNREYAGIVAGKANTLYVIEAPSINVNAIPDGPVGGKWSGDLDISEIVSNQVRRLFQ